MTRRWLNEERKAWLRQEWPKGTVRETLDRFNSYFGESVAYSQFKQANKGCRFGRARRTGCKLLNAEEWTWLRRCYRLWPVDETCRRFADRFGRRLTRLQIRNQAVRNGLRGAPNTGRFTKGVIPPNKGRKGWSAPGTEATRFRPGSVPGNKRPLYAERWSKHRSGPILDINVPERNPYTGFPNRWIRKAVWVWRQANGPVPPGHVVVQLDGDPANCELENLACVPRGVLSVLNCHVGGKSGPGANPARVRLAQLRWMLARRDS